MSSLADTPPVRHGTARLVLQISGASYSVRKVAPVLPGSRSWSVRRLVSPRLGRVYCVSRWRGQVSCTCPDHRIHGSRCKHMSALAAVGLLPRRFQVAAGSFGSGLEVANA